MMKKFLALALAVLVVCSLCVIPTAAAEAYNSDVTVSATVTPDTVKVNNLPGTVTFTIKTSKTVELFSIGYKIVVPEGWTIEKIESGSSNIVFRPVLDCSLDKGTVSWYSAQNIATDTIGKITVKVPAGETVGNKTITVKNVELSTTGKNNDNPWMSAGTASATVTLDKDIPVAGVRLDATSATLYVGENKILPLVATIVPDNATNKNVTWSTSNANVATVSNGAVSAVAPGTAKITVKTEDGGFTATCDVTVKAKVAGVSLDKTSLTLDEGKDATVTATIDPADASNKNVTWKSSDESVATVNGGKITAKKAGKATITVTTEDGSFKATCEVTVIARVSGVTLDQTTLNLEENKTADLTATVAPANAANKNVTWKSSDESVATVNGGKITAKKAGKATITVTTEDGNFTASCEVTVIARVSGVELNNKKLSLVEGDEGSLTATVKPSNAQNKNITWKSSDASIVSVDGGKVKALKVGKATITVTTEDGNFTATCEVTVSAKEIPVSGISIDIKEIELTVEDTKALQITVAPADATNPAVVWTSSDESVATVKDGIVTALKAGTTTITVTTEDGGFSASCEVTVSEKTIAVTGVTLDAEAVTLKVNETKTLTATVAPADASNLGVIWSSSDESVATVVDGVVTALKAGTATITATSVDGSFTAECVITVEEEVSPVTADMTVGASLVLCAAALAALVIEKKRKAR